MRDVIVVVLLLAATALSGCIFRHDGHGGHGSNGVSVEYREGQGPQGPPPGRGWRK